MSDFDWTKIDWADLYPRLLLFAARKMDHLTWRGKRFGDIPGARTPQDVVHECIVKTIGGERTWDRKYSLFNHLEGAISSEISHLVRSAENRITRSIDDKVVPIADHREDPETAAARKAHEASFFTYLEGKDTALRQLAFSILYDPSPRSTSELAVKMNLSVRELESLKRALKRATEEFLRIEQATNEQSTSDPMKGRE
jgi:DNA-directed RNA polymerase specialized sigma24 family protein